MVHAHVPSPHAMRGQLLERPSPARIAAFTGVIALHATALFLLMMPMAAPEPAAAREEVIPIVLAPPPKIVEPPPPPPTPPVRRTAIPRTVEIATPRPPILVEESSDPAPPVDTPDIEETIVAPPIETGPIAAAKLDYAFAPPPPYPNDARRRRIEGTVYLQVLVDVDGRPLDVLVQRSSGNRSLDDAARKQVLNRWRFQPATRDGVPVQAVGIVPVKFSMQ